MVMNRKPVLLSVLGLLTAPVLAQSAADRIMTEAMKPSRIQESLRVLTDEIGGRVPGTPAMQKAIAWGRDELARAGAKDVKTESFNLPSSWIEGETRLKVIAPVEFSVRGVSIAWAPATNGPLRARVVDIGNGSDAEIGKSGEIQGAILLVHSKVLETWDDLFQEYLVAPPIIDAAIKGKAAAIAFTASREHD